ncbi:hypothetical protein GGI21_001355, partial [Coemansia aciculifera]
RLVPWATEWELGLQPETHYVLDLELPSDFVPVPMDGEVESFQLLSVDETLEQLKRGDFKPDCVVCAVDFLIRHGVITPDNEPDYLAIIDSLHSVLPYPPPPRAI